MTESNNDQPIKQIHDNGIAWDMAYAEKPYRELESHARELGLGHIAADMAAYADSASGVVGIDLETKTTTSYDNLECEVLGSTELDRLVVESVSMVSAYSGGTDQYVHIPGVYDGVSRKSPNLDQATGSLLSAARTVFHSAKSVSKLIEKGIPEAITVGVISDVVPNISSRWKQGGAVTGKTHVFMYETLGGDKYPFRDTHGRSGNSLVYKLFLTEDEAEALMEAALENPKLAREIGSKLLDQQAPSEAPRPPYEHWQEINNGVNRIAFCHSYSQVVDGSEIVEF